jgi:hypothetical protein
MLSQKASQDQARRFLFFCVLVLLAPLLPSFARSQTANTSPLWSAIYDYRTATPAMRFAAANKLRQTLERGSNTEFPVVLKAEATILLSDFAISDRKKDLALKLTRKGQALLKGSMSPSAPQLLALAARVETQALLADQERLAALETVVKARLAYGTPKLVGGSHWDPHWDQLAMWQSITIDTLRGPERAKGVLKFAEILYGHNIESENAKRCKGYLDRVKRLNPELGKPNFPIVPMLAGQTGAVFMRLSLDGAGQVTETVVTAFSYSEDFAILAENAVRTWKHSVPPDVNPECLKGLPQIFLYVYG